MIGKIITTLFVILLICGIAFLGFQYYSLNNQFKGVLNTSNINKNVLTFNKLFINKVLKAKSEVSYEDRLKLENAAVSTKDNEIINAWHNFLASTKEQEAQERVLILLGMFPDKIIY